MRFNWRAWTWLCVSLMLWTALAESTHSHANQTESASCSICVVAHSTTPAAICNHPEPAFALVGLTQEKEDAVRARLSISKLGIRGPPAS